MNHGDFKDGRSAMLKKKKWSSEIYDSEMQAKKGDGEIEDLILESKMIMFLFPSFDAYVCVCV